MADNTESGVRTGVAIGHSIGGGILTGFGLGGFVPVIGTAEDAILGAAYGKKQAERISPQTTLNRYSCVKNADGSMTCKADVGDTPPIVVAPASLKAQLDMEKR